MGTRHLIGVIKDKKWKVAQYGQWDGYPDGQGRDILAFLKTVDLQLFSKKVEGCYFGTEAEIEAAYTPYSTDGWMNMTQSQAFKNSPLAYLGRDTGSDILKYISESENGLMLQDSSSFAGDSLFCEWAYVIDLDDGVFEVYKGFNKEPLVETERFASLAKSGSEYGPVKLATAFFLADLPQESDFLAAFKEEDEEEDD